jgi:hypothetical protein
MIKVICIKSIGLLKEGDVYYTDDDYYLIFDNDTIIYIDSADGRTLGAYHKNCFITVAEYREQQIKSVIDDN